MLEQSWGTATANKQPSSGEKNSISSLSFLSTQAVPLLPVPFSSVTPTNLCSGSACLRISLTTASYFKLYKGSLSREQCRSFGESPEAHRHAEKKTTQDTHTHTHKVHAHTHTQSTRTHAHLPACCSPGDRDHDTLVVR